jgi:hypothetical protein
VSSKPPEMRVRLPLRQLPRGKHVGIIRVVQKPHFIRAVDCWGYSGAIRYLTTNTKMNQINGLSLTQLPAPSVYRPPYSSTAVSPLDAALCEPARRIAARRQLGGRKACFTSASASSFRTGTASGSGTVIPVGHPAAVVVREWRCLLNTVVPLKCELWVSEHTIQSSREAA